MGCREFTEKEVRSSIINKISPHIPKSRAPHEKGHIMLDDKVVLIITIPNPHSKSFWQKKAKRLAVSLKLTCDEYNDFVSCKLSGKDYYALLKERAN